MSAAFKAGVSDAMEVVTVQDVLTLGKEVSGAVLPPLKPLFALLELVYAKYATMKQNKKQGLQLSEFCRTVVLAIQSNVQAGLALDDKLLQLEVMQKLLKETSTELEAIGKYTAIQSFIHHERIKQVITDRRVELADCFTAFGLTSQLRLHFFIQELAKAAKEDLQMLHAIQESTFAIQHTAERIETSVDALVTKVDSFLQAHQGPPTMAGAIRVVQLRMRMEPEGSDAQLSNQTLLRDMLRQAGNPLLPLSDLVGEARKVGTSPVSSNTYAEVWMGAWLGDVQCFVALKYPRTKTSFNQSILLKIHRQVQILHRVKHRNIIQLYGVKYGDEGIEYFVFPWMRNGDIMAYIKREPSADRLKLMLQVARGLEYLHKENIVHRSVHPRNILINDAEEAVVSDFGLAKILDLESSGISYTLSNGAETQLRWMAPELSDGTCDTPADVYAWAMTALQVISGHPPFHTVKQPGRVVILVHNGGRPKREDYAEDCFSVPFWNLLSRCWAHQPTSRPTMTDVVREIVAMRPDLA